MPTTVSVRQVQLPQTQFYEAKPYPAFTPIGPALVRLGVDELKRFTDLRRKLWVNGKLRQNVTAADMVHPPADALRALARFQRLDLRASLNLAHVCPAPTAVAPPWPNFRNPKE